MRMLSFEEFVISLEAQYDESEYQDENGNYKDVVEHESNVLGLDEKGEHAKIGKVKVTLRHTGNGTYEGSYLHPQTGQKVNVKSEIATLPGISKKPLRLEKHLSDDGITHNWMDYYLQDEAAEKDKDKGKNTEHSFPTEPHENGKEISRFKKYGKYGVGVAAVGGLAYGGYKLLHRNQNTSNEMLSFEEFVDVIN